MPSVCSRHVAAVCESFERRTLLSVSVAGEPWEAIRKSDFSDVSDMTLNGSATNEGTGGRLRLTDAVEGEAGSAFFDTPRSVRYWDQPVGNGFTAEFTFEVSAAGAEPAEGWAFVLHNDPRRVFALGVGERGLGWEGLENSVGVKFDVGARGAAQTGLYLHGEPISV